MAAPCLVGTEHAADGTLATALMAVGNLDMKPAQKNKVLVEQRGSQEINFNVVAGRQWEERTVRDSLIVRLGKIAYEEAEIDTETDLPTLKAKGKALSNATETSVTLYSTHKYDDA